MLCLSDTDFIIKFAEFDLLSETLSVLGVSRSDFRVLPELSRVLQGERLRLRHTQNCIERATKFAKGLKSLAKIDRQEHMLLSTVRAHHRNRLVEIHGGEATLFCATKFVSDYIVATGDKGS